MKTYIANWDSCFGLCVMIINAENIDKARNIILKEGDYGTMDNIEIRELDNKTDGVTYFMRN